MKFHLHGIAVEDGRGAIPLRHGACLEALAPLVFHRSQDHRASTPEIVIAEMNTHHWSGREEEDIGVGHTFDLKPLSIAEVRLTPFVDRAMVHLCVVVTCL